MVSYTCGSVTNYRKYVSAVIATGTYATSFSAVNTFTVALYLWHFLAPRGQKVSAASLTAPLPQPLSRLR